MARTLRNSIEKRLSWSGEHLSVNVCWFSLEINQHFYNRMHVSILRKMHLPHGARILDLGCYDGKKNAWALKKGFLYQGIDMRYESQQIKKTDFIPWLKENRRRFDLILLEFSLQQISKKNVRQVIKDIKRIMNPNGYLFIASFNERDAYGPFFTQKEYFAMCHGLRILLWSSKYGKDKNKRQRSVTEILLKK